MKNPAISTRELSCRITMVIIVTMFIGGGTHNDLMAQASEAGRPSYLENRHDPDFPGRRNFNAGVMATIVIMRDARLIRAGDFKVFPINPFLKLIYSF